MSAEYTIVFEGHPRDIPGNPFDFKSPFGAVTTVSAGNVCEDADRYREALEAIAEGSNQTAAALAQEALDERSAALAANINAMRAKPKTVTP